MLLLCVYCILAHAGEERPHLSAPYHSQRKKSMRKWYVYFVHVVFGCVSYRVQKCCLVAPISTSTVSVLNIARVSVCIWMNRELQACYLYMPVFAAPPYCSLSVPNSWVELASEQLPASAPSLQQVQSISNSSLYRLQSSSTVIVYNYNWAQINLPTIASWTWSCKRSLLMYTEAPEAYGSLCVSVCVSL